MIVSHSNKFIFFAVPKTATHSVRSALQAYCTPEDWQQQALFRSDSGVAQTLPIPEIAKIEHGHISAQQIQAKLPKDMWAGYLKFGFVRNPFDRFISVCFFLNRKNSDFGENSLDWMKSAITHPRFQQRVLVQPQYKQLISLSGEVILDIIGRYENLQDSMNSILTTLDLDTVQLDLKNTSNHKYYQQHYDDELKELIAEFYQEDLQRFDYAF